MNKILEIKNLKKVYKSGKLQVEPLKDINLTINQGEIIGIFGNSGCGKSTLAKAIVGIENIESGEINYKGINISNKQQYKANKTFIQKNIRIIFQSFSASLNDNMKIYEIVCEPGKLMKTDCKGNNVSRFYYNKANSIKEATEILELVGLNKEIVNKYPYELSLGQRQRVSISRGIFLKPDILIADEPFASLDMSVQGGIINLLKKLNKEYKMSILLISHDYNVINYMCDRKYKIVDGILKEI